ncbi:MAG: 5'/3'-nucleotidase SurE [Deltaproteobacteria bacterium]|nr:5'/3'-nucleotidase SurE [Deltaproteobacteria bacterium]
MRNYNILITNDDGIESPGLRAAVKAVIDIGNVTIVAPSHQQTGTGRGLTGDKLSCLKPIEYQINGREIPAYHCECSPALIVRHSLRTIFKENIPDLLVSGINYGENLGINITSSGTIGAALEGASSGIPGIAISKQTDIESHHRYTDQDWTASSFFLNRFAKSLLSKKIQSDVDVLKIDVPSDATLLTEFKITRLAKVSYYSKAIENPTIKSRIGDGKTIININGAELDPESDIYAFAIDRFVSVTPLSVDLTSRVQLSELQRLLCK